MRARAARIRVAFRDPQASTVVDGKGDRLLHVRLRRENLRAETRRQRHLLHRLVGRKPRVLHHVARWPALARHLHRGELRLRLEEAEVIEVHMPPALAHVIHEPDENLSPLDRCEIDDGRQHRLGVVTARLKKHLTRVRPHQLDARARMRAAVEPERREGLRHLEPHGSERPARSVLKHLIAADPVFALVIGHAPAAKLPLLIDRPLVRLPLERRALRRPVAQRPILEIEVQRLAIPAHRQRSARLRQRIGSSGERGGEDDGDSDGGGYFHGRNLGQ